MIEAVCSAASLAVGEGLAGTATASIDRWLLLEFSGRWAPKPLESPDLPARVRTRLERWLSDDPRSRLQFIRRPGRVGRRPVFCLVSAGLVERGIARVELDRLEALLETDLEQMRESATADHAPICLVCAHGRRDRCCGQHGAAFFRALQGEEVELWQTSHLGGHRFAACALWLPHGLMYGRLRPEHSASFVAALGAGTLGERNLFRGRCALDRPTQAAEIFLRERLDEDRLDSVRWLETHASDPERWEARFEVEGVEHHVRIRLEQDGSTRPTSCGAKPEAVTRYRET